MPRGGHKTWPPRAHLRMRGEMPRKLDARAHAELAVDLGQVRLHRLAADEHLGGDLGVRAPAAASSAIRVSVALRAEALGRVTSRASSACVRAAHNGAGRPSRI